LGPRQGFERKRTERREQFHALRLGENLDPLNPVVNSYIAEAQPGYLQQTGDPVAAQQVACSQ
jgi:DHA2 family multidrug resistance protein